MNFYLGQNKKKYLIGTLITSFFVVSTLLITSAVTKPKTTTFQTGTKAETPLNRIVLQPQTITPNSNGEFTLRVKIATVNATKGQMYKINLTFPKNDLQIKEQGITYKIGAVSTVLKGDENANINEINTRDNGSGLADLNLIAEITNPPEGEIFSQTTKEVATVVFKTISTNGGRITATEDNFLKSINNTYGIETLTLSGQSSTVVFGQAPTSSLSPNPTSTDTPPQPSPTRTVTPTQPPLNTPTTGPAATVTTSPQCANLTCPMVTNKQPGKLSAGSCYVDLAWTATEATSYRVCRNMQCYITALTGHRLYGPCNNTSLYKVSPIIPDCPNFSCPVFPITTPL